MRDFFELCNDDSFFASDSGRNTLDDLYINLISSAVGVIKCDVVDDDYLRNLQGIRKDVSKMTKKQSKNIISFCDVKDDSCFKIELERYNFLHFIKFMIRIMDEDDRYKYNVQCCKHYFSDKQCLQLTEHLYNHKYATWTELSSTFSLINETLPTKYSEVFSIKIKDDEPIVTLTPQMRNLYAFYSMKHIKIDSNDEDESENYNEGKVNEVLEYLISYISNPQEGKKNKKPKLHSSSANNNLDRLLSIINKNLLNKDTYNSHPIQTDVSKDDKIRLRKGYIECKKIF